MKKYLLGIISLAILVAAAIWWLEREPTLAELQKQYLLAKTKADSANVVERLEKYYLNLSIPDTIRQRVDSEVAAQVDTTKITLAEVAPDTNVYRLESRLQDLLRLAAIARARDDNQTFQNLVRQAQAMAKTVDAGTQNNYWAPVVDRINTFNKEQAFNWLKAIKAENLCRLYHNNISKIADAERYATLGLNLLQQVKDERIYLDIIQRLQWILYFHHSVYELSIALAQKALPRADKIKYHLRSNGFAFVQAETLFKMGQNQAALARYEAVFSNAEKFRQITDMNRFTNPSLIGQGEVYRVLGEFEKAWNACREVSRLPLNQAETINLQILKFNILKATGHYTQAKEELKKAISLATRPEDFYKRIMCLNNLGALHAGLADYDLALTYYKQAQSLFTTSSPDLSTRLLVLENIADILAAKNDSIGYRKILQEAQKLLKLTNSSYRQAQLLSTIGGWYQKNVKKYYTAIEYHHKADSIFYQNGFLRFALITKMDLVDCLIALSRFREAKTLIAEIEHLAREINDIERLIDTHDRTAQIHYREGHLARAVSSSNAALHEIAEMSSRFQNQELLIAYRQKVYDLLKYAVLYNIALQRLEIAFAMLDSAKAYALKSRLSNNHADNHRREANGKNTNFDLFKARLQVGQLLLDYMMTSDTLYVFVLDRDGLQLLRKSIDIEALQKTANAYKDSINKTFHIIQAGNSDRINAHYTNTVALAQKLYQELLGWPEIKSRLQRTDLLYVILDEFLYDLPFSTLTVNSREAQTFLANRSAVLNLPSAGFLRNEYHADAVPNGIKTMKVLVSADKRFPGADKFVAQVKALFPLAEEPMVQNSTFTKDEVRAQLQKDYSIYIFVGHGQANSQYPDQGYIELSVKTSGAPTAKIARLTMADLKTISWLRAEMVMLVGCETAGGKLYRGTGISGLQQEFLALGVKNVLGNLWEVNAPHAIAQARDFLTIWAATGNSSRALRESQLKAVQGLQGHRYYQQPHPYFWGSAVLLTTTLQ